MSAILLRTTIATLIAFGGGAMGVALGQMASRRLSLLIYAATGVLLAVTVCDILPEAREGLAFPAFLLAAGSGYLLFWLIGRYVYHICPACAFAHFDEASTRHLARTVIMLMVALGLHSLMDGIAVAVSGALPAGQASIGVMLAISVHKLPEGMALALLLLGAGYGRWRALWFTCAIESTTELGGLLGVLALRGASPTVLHVLFAHVGGGFLYLVVSAYKAMASHPGRQPVRLLVLTGGVSFVLSALLLLLTGH